QVLQQAKKAFQQLKQYYQYQSGGALTDEQQIILRNRLNDWIAERQSERERDENAPPPITQQTPTYDKITLLKDLKNTNEGVFVKGNFTVSTSLHQLYGIKVNNRYYAIFIKNDDFDNIYIVIL
ncbi:hypothetical protein EB001_16810, partial [bacterium]|nr:hypothetical protein [bacterium]